MLKLSRHWRRTGAVAYPLRCFEISEATRTGWTQLRRLGTRIAFPLLVLIACWPMAPWVYARWTSPTGSVFCAVLFIATVVGWLGILYRRTESPQAVQSPVWLAGAAFFLALFALFYQRVPGLVSSELGACALACTMMAVLPQDVHRRLWAIPILITFSIPLTPSLQFFLGYPLRVVVAKGAALMIGSQIEPVGVGLSDGVHTVFVDAPCSGIRMLTTSIMLASGAAFCLRLTPFRTAVLLLLSVFTAILGNALRAASLFILEIRLPLGPQAHGMVGMVIFAGCALFLIWSALLMKRTEGKQTERSECGPENGLVRLRGAILWTQNGLEFRETILRRGITTFFALAWLAAFCAPWVSGQTLDSKSPKEIAIQWPVSWNGQPLVSVPLEEPVRNFLRGFPGRMAQFRVGESEQKVLLRLCLEATRDLHPAEDCHKVLGWRCIPLPAIRDAQGHTWSRFRSVRPDGTETTVRQCYFLIPAGAVSETIEELVQNVPSWPDVSSWYWAAARPTPRRHMTLAITVSE